MRRTVTSFSWACVALTGLILAANYVFTQMFGDAPQAPRTVATIPGQTAPPPSAPPAISHDPRDAIRSELRTTSGDLRDASRSINRALSYVDVWEREIEPLRGNSEGEAIMQQDELRAGMVVLLDAERPRAEELELTQDRIRALLDMVDRQADEAVPAPIAATDKRESLNLQRQATDALTIWRDAVEQAQALVRLSRPASERSTIQDELDLKQLPAIDEREKQNLAKAKAERERERLRREATTPSVRRVLAPFLVGRYQQPKRYGSSIRFDKVLERQPMSLTRLQVVGALDESIRGLEMLARVGTSHHLSQPRWDFYFEARSWSEDTLENVREAQRMLREYGSILVEEGWLAE